MCEECAKKEKALAFTEGLWRLEKEKRQNLEAQIGNRGWKPLLSLRFWIGGRR